MQPQMIDPKKKTCVFFSCCVIIVISVSAMKFHRALLLRPFASAAWDMIKAELGVGNPQQGGETSTGGNLKKNN